MELKVGKEVKITRRDGLGETGTIIKISDTDPQFKYLVKTNDGKEYWKEEKSIFPLNLVVTEAPKKRGRPSTKTKADKLKKDPVKDVKQVDKSLLDKYHELCNTLTFEEFIQLRKIVNEDYQDIMKLINETYGLRL